MQNRFGAPHPDRMYEVCLRRRKRPESDYCRCRRGRAFAGHDRGFNADSRARRADTIKSAVRPGSLLSIVQMPAGVPVGTLAIGEAGAKNAALLAAAIVANEDAELAERLDAWRAARTADVQEFPSDDG